MNSIANSKAKITKRSSNSYSGEEWKSHRPLITRLYFEDGRTLKEVREHLEREFGFAPTERMYKSRLHQWGLDKKKKEHEMLDLVRQGLQQKGADKDKVFIVRGRQVTLADALHYFNRKGIKDPSTLLDSHPEISRDHSSAEEEDDDVQTPLSSRGDLLDATLPLSDSDYDIPRSPEHSYQTQPSNRFIDFKTSNFATNQLRVLCRQLGIDDLQALPPFRNVAVEATIQHKQSSDLEQRYLDAILAQSQEHYRQIFSCQEISIANTSSAPWSATSGDALADQFYYAMYHGYSTLWNGQRQSAFEDFYRAFGMIQQLLKENQVGFLIYVFDLIIRHDGTGYEEPLLLLLDQLADMAETLYGDRNHPIFLIASWMRNAPPEVSRSSVAVATLRRLLDFFQDSIGYFHPETIALLQTFATGLLNKRLYSEAAVRFQQLVDAFSTIQSRQSYEVCYALRSTSEAFFHDGKFKESLQSLKMALEWSVGIPHLEEREIHVRCLRAMAEISNKIGLHDDALRTMQHVVDICADTFGVDHAFTKRARMHQKSLRKGETTTDAAIPPMVYRLGRGGDAAKWVWTTRSSPTRLQP